MIRGATIAFVFVLTLSTAAPARAYSVLAHEAMVDAAWDDVIAPLLKRRFPLATRDDIMHARAFAYGGSVMPDMGYYPFGSHLFTNLVHYVRSGDFVEALVRDATTVNEMAFALGAMAHYSADNAGHPLAVNRSVALIYPKDKAKFGNSVTYVDDPKRHVMVEFAFDVVQVAAGAYLPDSYRAFLGFEVSKPLLERAFHETYGLEVKDLFFDTDLAIGTFRWAVSQTIPQMTTIAWRDKEEEIKKVTPTVQRSAFVYTITRQEYEHEYGTMYRKPGLTAKFFATVVKVLPKFGPFKPLAFKAPTPEAERLFAESFRTARQRYRVSLQDARDGRVMLANTNFDTGRASAWGEYSLADKTYRQFLDRLDRHHFAGVSPDLRSDLLRFFSSRPADARPNEYPVPPDVQRQLTALRQSTPN
jgi:hypothetical protein